MNVSPSLKELTVCDECGGAGGILREHWENRGSGLSSACRSGRQVLIQLASFQERTVLRMLAA